jgi:6-phosphogluconolactonase
MSNKNKFTRRDFFVRFGLGAAGFSLAQNLKAQNGDKSNKMLLYIGTYTSSASGSEGIYIYDFDAATGKLSRRQIVSGVEEPSFLTVDKKRR